MIIKAIRFTWKVVAYGSLLYCATEYGIEGVICEGPSMKPTIDHHDVLLAEHISVMMRNVQKGDIVICTNPSQADKLLCKRVKALEGEKVMGKVVPRGHVWLEGDNKTNSLDSNTFGAVPSALIRSRVILKIWPLNELGWLSNRWIHERQLPR